MLHARRNNGLPAKRVHLGREGHRVPDRGGNQHEKPHMAVVAGVDYYGSFELERGAVAGER